MTMAFAKVFAKLRNNMISLYSSSTVEYVIDISINVNNSK